MSWFKLDDGFFENPKIVALTDGAKVAYLEAGTYSARNLTDGFVPMLKAKQFTKKDKVLAELVPALWEPVDGGYQIHDYLAYNPQRVDVLQKRAKDLERKTGGKSADSRPIPRGIAADSKRPHPHPHPGSPSRPDPDPQPPSAEQVLAGRPRTFVLYEQLFGRGVSPLIADRLKEYEQSHTPECIEHCFVEAAEANARNVKLVYSILDRHAEEGCYAERNPNRNGAHEASRPAAPGGDAFMPGAPERIYVPNPARNRDGA